MIKFRHVEDYLEVIAGHRDPATGKPVSTWIFTFEPIINLARYDVKVLESMSQTVAQHQPLTERQGELLAKIVLKYERQLASKQVDVDPVRNPEWRMPLRKMDYTRSLYITNDQLVLKFPFDDGLIESVRAFGKESQGVCKWNRETKLWEIALTEYNLSWLVAFAEVHKFTVDTVVQDLMLAIKETELSDYKIELAVTADTLSISNCPDSLSKYITDTCNGFGLDNVLTLVDLSPILGYTINEDLGQALIKEYGPRFYNLLTNRELKINPNTLIQSTDFENTLDYADALQRWPVVVYEPDLSGRMLKKLTDKYGPDYDQTRYIHTVKPVRNLERIPLLISSAGMVFGGDKQLMIQRAEKVVYCAQDVYNKKNNSKVKHL